MANTQINPRQLKSVTGSFDSLFHELKDIATIQAENLMNVDINYEMDGNGNVVRELITDTSPQPSILSETTYTYSTDGNIESETVHRNGNRIVKTYKYNSSGAITGVSIRVNP